MRGIINIPITRGAVLVGVKHGVLKQLDEALKARTKRRRANKQPITAAQLARIKVIQSPAGQKRTRLRKLRERWYTLTSPPK